MSEIAAEQNPGGPRMAAVKVELCESFARRGAEEAWEPEPVSGPRFREQSWLAAQSEDRTADLADRIQKGLPDGFVIERSPLAWTERGVRAMTRLGAPSAVFRVRWAGPQEPLERWENGNLDLEAALSRAIRAGFKESEEDEPAYRALGDRMADRQMRSNLMLDREVAFWPEIVAQREAWLLGQAALSAPEGKRRGL